MNIFEKVAFVFGLLVAGVYLGWLAWPRIMRWWFGEGQGPRL